MSNGDRYPGFSDNISLAYYLRNNYEQFLLQDMKIKDLLVELDNKIEATWKTMDSTGVVEECFDCALNGGGSCCGAGMETKYDAILLLINLLLGWKLPKQAQDQSSCFFLSEYGCTLRAHQVICVDYLCQRIKSRIVHEKILHLQTIVGEELKTLFILQEYMKGKIRKLEVTHQVNNGEAL